MAMNTATSVMTHIGDDDKITAHPLAVPGQDKIVVRRGDTTIFRPTVRVDELCAARVAAHASAHQPADA